MSPSRNTPGRNLTLNMWARFPVNIGSTTTLRSLIQDLPIRIPTNLCDLDMNLPSIMHTSANRITECLITSILHILTPILPVARLTQTITVAAATTINLL